MRKKIGKKWVWIIAGGIVVVTGMICGGYFLLSTGKQKEEMKEITGITVLVPESCPVNEKPQLEVWANGVTENGEKKKVKLSKDQYLAKPQTAPEHGHDFVINVTLKSNSAIQASETILVERNEIGRYDLGRTDPDQVQAVLYDNGDLEIQGSGEVKKFNEADIPWKEDGVSHLSWIDPEADVESMDYWFSRMETFQKMLCPVPDTVKSMVETFSQCVSMTSVPDMSTAVNLEDLTGCYKESAVTDGGEWPGNLKTAEAAYKNCTKLVYAADGAACVRLQSMKNCYNGCTALADTNTPDCVENMEGAYQNCLNIKHATIPSKVINMASAFSGCTGLISMEGTIPSSCESLSGTFKDCKFLSGKLKINCSMSSLSGAFSGAARNGSGLTVILAWAGEEEGREVLQRIKGDIEQQASKEGCSIMVTID